MSYLADTQSYGTKRRRYSSVGGPSHRRRAAPKKRFALVRAPRGVTQVFTETYAGGTCNANSPGLLFNAVMATIPEISGYQRLWRSYRILKFAVMLMPNQIVNTVGGVAPNGETSVARIAWSPEPSASTTPPTSETDVLNCANSRVQLLNGPLRCTVSRPKPYLTMTDPSGPSPTSIFVDTAASQWLKLDNAGILVPHVGIPAYITGLSLGALGSANIPYYIKVWFQCKDAL